MKKNHHRLISVTVAAMLALSALPATPAAADDPGAYDLLSTTFNTSSVMNGPEETASMTLQRRTMLQVITTYHWNDGHGATPGYISILKDGVRDGIWQATGRSGSGADNVLWDVYPNYILEPGYSYTFVDSDPDTWSWNSAATFGFIELRGYVIGGPSDPGTGTATGNSSADGVKCSEWAKPEVEKAVALDIMPPALLSTDLTQPISRADFAAISVNVYEAMSGNIVDAVSDPFRDTNDGSVLKAYSAGIVNGTSDTTFDPDGLLTREQAATMLTRAYKKTVFPGWSLADDQSFRLSYTSSGGFSDSGSISGYAAESVDYMSANGVINGVGNNRFDPKSSVTREQAIAIAVRMAGRLDTSPQTPVQTVQPTAQPTTAPDSGIHWVEVTIPAPTAAEEAVDVTAALALENYMTARAYLDRFLTSDISSVTETQAAEYKEMLGNAITLFENTEKLSDALTKAVDVWEKTDGDVAPTYRELSYAGQQSGAPANFGSRALMKPTAGIMTRVFAADSSAVAWAKDITDRYDKAPAGKGIRTLASQLGTDAKHAYAQLKQAQAILEGATYTEIAEAANTAYKTATVLKTAGTAAGLVISVAAAPAAGAVGAAVKTGGVVMGGINTLLEIGSTGTILYTNGEGNELTAAFDKTESQMAPIGQIFSIAGLGYSLKDIGTTGKKIWESGYKSLTQKEMNDLGDNAFGVLSYAASSLNDYINGGSILSGTFTKTENGTKFTLMNTLLGNDENTKTALTNAGISQDIIDSALNGSLPATAPGTAMPDSVSTSIINKNAPLVKDGGFDVDSFINKLMSSLTEIAELSDIVKTPTPTAAPDNGNYSTNPFEDGRIVTDVPTVSEPDMEPVVLP